MAELAHLEVRVVVSDGEPARLVPLVDGDVMLVVGEVEVVLPPVPDAERWLGDLLSEYRTTVHSALGNATGNADGRDQGAEGQAS